MPIYLYKILIYVADTRDRIETLNTEENKLTNELDEVYEQNDRFLDLAFARESSTKLKSVASCKSGLKRASAKRELGQDSKTYSRCNSREFRRHNEIESTGNHLDHEAISPTRNDARGSINEQRRLKARLLKGLDKFFPEFQSLCSRVMKIHMIRCPGGDR